MHPTRFAGPATGSYTRQNFTESFCLWGTVSSSEIAEENKWCFAIALLKFIYFELL